MIDVDPWCLLRRSGLLRKAVPWGLTQRQTTRTTLHHIPQSYPVCPHSPGTWRTGYAQEKKMFLLFSFWSNLILLMFPTANRHPLSGVCQPKVPPKPLQSCPGPAVRVGHDPKLHWALPGAVAMDTALTPLLGLGATATERHSSFLGNIGEDWNILENTENTVGHTGT